MSHSQTTKRVTVPSIAARKGSREKIVCLTAYTSIMAALFDPHCDILLVGDSVGMVLHGMSSTLGVSLDLMISHAQAVLRGSSRALITVDLPFGSFEESPEKAFETASRVVAATGCQAIKVEAVEGIGSTISFLVGRGIPVMAHVGLRPQSVNVDGGFIAKGRTGAERSRVLAEAREADSGGAFAIVVEGVTSDLADEVTKSVRCPTIGIGASGACDGQILVAEDMLGLFERAPRFVRRYTDLRSIISNAVIEYARDVRNGTFPNESECYKPRPVPALDRNAPKSSSWETTQPAASP